jgi:uncharacterized protein YciI
VTSPPALEPHTLVLLRRPPDASDLPEDELDALQERHLAHLRAMRERGVILASAPVEDPPDPSLRGLCVYRTGLEESRRLAELDPAMQAGRLAVEVLTWWTPGTIGLSAAGG